MQTKFWLAGLCAVAIALSGVNASTDAFAQTHKKRVATKKAAKKYGPVPISMAPPRSRITITRRSFLDPGREVIPGSRHEFTDYALPPGYSPTAVIDNRGPFHRSPLPGPFDLPGRDNPYPWNWCVGC